MNAAPVFVGTLNRYEHFVRTVDSLRSSLLAPATHLFVGLDHPLKDSHIPGHNKICQYLDNLDGFKEITVIRRPQNFGAIKNFREGKAQVLKQYDRIIVTEDDNWFSANFLQYINMGLDRFQADKRIFAICGHNYPIEISDKYAGNVYAWKGISVWGYGIWRDRYECFNYQQYDVKRFLRSPKKLVKAYEYAPHYISNMICAINGKHGFDPFMDALICMHLIKSNQYCVFPTVSKVRNYGHDGTGIHGGKARGLSIYSNQTVDASEWRDFIFSEDEFLENPYINKLLFRHFYKGPKQTVKTTLALLKLWLGTCPTDVSV